MPYSAFRSLQPGDSGLAARSFSVSMPYSAFRSLQLRCTGSKAARRRCFNALLGIPVVAAGFRCQPGLRLLEVSMPYSAFRSLQRAEYLRHPRSPPVSMPYSAFRSLQPGIEWAGDATVRGFNALLGIPVVAAGSGLRGVRGAVQFQCPTRHSGRCSATSGVGDRQGTQVSMPYSAFRSLQHLIHHTLCRLIHQFQCPTRHSGRCSRAMHNHTWEAIESFNALLGIPVVAAGLAGALGAHTARFNALLGIPVVAAMSVEDYAAYFGGFNALLGIPVVAASGPRPDGRRRSAVSMPYSAFRSLQPMVKMVAGVPIVWFQCPTRHSGRCSVGASWCRSTFPVVSMPYSAFRSLQRAAHHIHAVPIRVSMPYSAFRSLQRHMAHGRIGDRPGFNALLGIPVVAAYGRAGWRVAVAMFQCPTRHSGRCSRRGAAG